MSAFVQKAEMFRLNTSPHLVVLLLGQILRMTVSTLMTLVREGGKEGGKEDWVKDQGREG